MNNFKDKPKKDKVDFNEENEPNTDLDKDTHYNFDTFEEFYEWVKRLNNDKNFN